jgi:prepilin-type N-terminal cleavage/methylation domain-containing protein
MTRPFARIRSRHQKTAAFTLVEMLVVITIIAILAALLIPAVISAQRRAQSTRIKMEIDQLATGFEDYRNDMAGEYPPNCWYVNEANHTANAVVRHFKKAFPRHREPEALIRGLSGYGGTGPQVLPGGLNPAEAVYFWLGGFSSDPKYPISGPGGPSFLVGQLDNIEDRNRTYDFDLARLGTGEGIDVKTAIQDGSVRSVQYVVSLNGRTQTRRINFWQYYPPKSTKPFVYFDTSRSKPRAHETAIYASAMAHPSIAGVAPIKRLATTLIVPGNPTTQDVRYANEDKFQILHAGVDDDWGGDIDSDSSLFDPLRVNFTNPSASLSPGTILYPDGPFTAELGDTVVNFDQRTLQDAQP